MRMRWVRLRECTHCYTRREWLMSMVTARSRSSQVEGWFEWEVGGTGRLPSEEIELDRGVRGWLVQCAYRQV
jgi:hypothetical protein